MKSIQIECTGYSVAADLYECDNPDAVLLNLVGYSSNKERYREFMEALQEQIGCTILTFDYSGHGESPFNLPDLRPAQNFLEVIEVYDWLAEQHSNKKLFVMGASYGGFLAAKLTNYRKFDKLILRVPALYEPHLFYTKWRNMDRQANRAYRNSGTNLQYHPLLRKADSFEGDSLVVTHELDDVCPPHSTQPFVEAFNADHWEAKGLKHGFGESNVAQEIKDAYYKKVADWLKA